MIRQLASLEKIGTQFANLHADVAAVILKTIETRPELSLVVRRSEGTRSRRPHTTAGSRSLQLRLACWSTPSASNEVNAAIRHSARFSVYASVRDSARGLLVATSGAINGLQNQLDFRGSLALSILALIVAVVALFV